MTSTCPSCYSCGMPLKNPSDFSLGNTSNKYCSHCTDEKGNLRAFEEIVKDTANYLIHSQGLDKSAALEVSKNMISNQPEWKGKI